MQTLINLENEGYEIGSPDISGAPGDKPAVNFALFTAGTWNNVAASDAGLITGTTITDKGNAVFAN